MEGIPNFEAKAHESHENTERPSFHFIYVDHAQEKHPVIFECDADNIMLADEMYEKKLGEKPERQNHIGCSIVRN